MLKRFGLCLVFVGLASSVRAEIKPIARVLPPTDGIKLPDDKHEAIEKRLDSLQKRLATWKQKHPTEAAQQHVADAEVYLKAVAYALEFNEFYNAKDPDKATAALKSAEERIAALEAGKASWKRQTGTVARGYYSRIDDSPQPFGLVIPEKHDFEKPCPLYVWLHGRGDKQTDLHFLIEREKNKGQITPPGAIVLHPFGRHCVGFKHAGEIDVLEAIEAVQRDYKIDDKRIVLIGFSMGGAGAWHLGAHYADKWAVVSPGAGFAETAQYTKTDPAKVPEYERILWGVYDVPDYVRNLFNTRVIAYSGENDKQIQAARVMEAAYEKEGRQLEHLIGPGVEHKYEPETLKKLLAKIEEELKNPVTARPREKIDIQSRSLRYAQFDGIHAYEAENLWDEIRISMKRKGETREIVTKNVKTLTVNFDGAFSLNGVPIVRPSSNGLPGHFTLAQGKWTSIDAENLVTRRSKHARLQGPIDDAFLDPFLVVTPSGRSSNAAEQEWIDFELNHFLTRWKALMRGEPRVKKDRDVTGSDLQDYHVIVWGTPESNSLLAEIEAKLPVKFDQARIRFGTQSYDRGKHLPAFIYPNPFQPANYLVLNSGLTFREAHDKTNSQQNPKLPDWAIIDITQPPDANSPGKIVEAGFFDEWWKVK
jgi:predicted esterase